MNTRIVVGTLAATVLAVGCSRKKPEEGKEPPVANPGSGSAGSGSAAGSAAGSGSATADAPDPKLMERGEYLAKAFGCPVCHVYFDEKGPDFSKRGGGGLEIPEKFGTWHGPNISSDKGTGIGNWKVEDIMAAVRQGVRPDGSKLYPIMPYPNYNRMTDDDALALATFIHHLPPVEHQVPPNKDLKLPEIPVPKPENKPDEVGDPLKHGEYLVTIMHCNNCHAKAGKDGMPDMAHGYSGGLAFDIPFLGSGTLYAANITSDKDTGIGKWSDADIVKALKTMTRPDGTIIQGPMQFYQAGWSQMTDQDLAAVAAYVKTIPADKNKVPKSTFKPAGPPPGAGGPPGAGSAAGSGSAAASGSAAGSGSAAK